MIAKLFAARVLDGRLQFDAVPAKLKEQTALLLVQVYDRADLLPEGYHIKSEGE